METGECLAKHQLLKLYPDAYCQKTRDTWIIYVDQKRINHSFESEEMAWEWALTVTNDKILDKFKGN